MTGFETLRVIRTIPASELADRRQVFVSSSGDRAHLYSSLAPPPPLLLHNTQCSASLCSAPDSCNIPGLSCLPGGSELEHAWRDGIGGKRKNSFSHHTHTSMHTHAHTHIHTHTLTSFFPRSETSPFKVDTPSHLYYLITSTGKKILLHDLCRCRNFTLLKY